MLTARHRQLLPVAAVFGSLLAVAGCGAGEEPMPYEVVRMDAGPVVLRYVMVWDHESPETSSPTATSGVDIDAIKLDTGDESFFANEVVDCSFGPGDVGELAGDCGNALGPPEGGCDPEAPDFVSLGGNGGVLIVSFGDGVEISSGNQITVFECGQHQNAEATAEVYDAHVGATTERSIRNWTTCIDHGMATSTCIVP